MHVKIAIFAKICMPTWRDANYLFYTPRWFPLSKKKNCGSLGLLGLIPPGHWGPPCGIWPQNALVWGVGKRLDNWSGGTSPAKTDEWGNEFLEFNERTMKTRQGLGDTRPIHSKMWANCRNPERVSECWVFYAVLTDKVIFKVKNKFGHIQS